MDELGKTDEQRQKQRDRKRGKEQEQEKQNRRRERIGFRTLFYIALDAATPAVKIAAELFFVEGKSYDVITTKLNKKKGACRASVARFRKSPKKLLTEYIEQHGIRIPPVLKNGERTLSLDEWIEELLKEPAAIARWLEAE